MMDVLVSKSGKKIELRRPKEDDVELLYDFAKEIEQEDTFILLNPDEPMTMEDEKKYVDGLVKDNSNKSKIISDTIHLGTLFLIGIFDSIAFSF